MLGLFEHKNKKLRKNTLTVKYFKAQYFLSNV